MLFHRSTQDLKLDKLNKVVGAGDISALSCQHIFMQLNTSAYVKRWIFPHKLQMLTLMSHFSGDGKLQTNKWTLIKVFIIMLSISKFNLTTTSSSSVNDCIPLKPTS